MTLNEYLDGTVRRMMTGRKEPVGSPECRMNWVLGLASEVGEICDVVKKAQDRGLPIDREQLMGEVGDAGWYLSALALDILGDDPGDQIWRVEASAADLGELCLDLVGKAARVVQSVRSQIGGHDENGDSFWESTRWFAADLCSVGRALAEPFAIEDAWASNARKLATRFPNGFDPERARNRIDKGEVAVKNPEVFQRKMFGIFGAHGSNHPRALLPASEDARSALLADDGASDDDFIVPVMVSGVWDNVEGVAITARSLTTCNGADGDEEIKAESLGQLARDAVRFDADMRAECGCPANAPRCAPCGMRDHVIRDAAKILIGIVEDGMEGVSDADDWCYRAQRRAAAMREYIAKAADPERSINRAAEVTK